ncbi:MAG: TspO/MBR family protein [Steroidobacteraceae bacterium]
MSEPRSTLRPLAVAFVIATAVAATGAALTSLGPWYRELVKPAWQPPDWLFGPAWTLIFALCALAGAGTWRRAGDADARRRLLTAFAVNGVLNVTWSALFFRVQRPAWALVEVVLLWASIVVLIRVCAAVWRPAAWLLAPYLAWVSFASVLNAAIVRLNPA